MTNMAFASAAHWRKDGPLQFRLVKNGRECAAVDLDRRMVAVSGERPHYVPRSLCPFDAAEKKAGMRRVDAVRDVAGKRIGQDERREIEREVRRYRPMPKHNLLTARAVLEHAEKTGDLGSEGRAAAKHIGKALRAITTESWQTARDETALAVGQLNRAWSDVPGNMQMMALRFCEDAAGDLVDRRVRIMEALRDRQPEISR